MLIISKHARPKSQRQRLSFSLPIDLNLEPSTTTMASDSPVHSPSKAILNYTIPPANGIRPYQYTTADPITGERRKNYTQEPKEVVIENLRGKEHLASLDTTGFQYFKHPSKHTLFTNDEDIVKEYYPETIELIKKYAGASRVVIFDHTVRRRRPGKVNDEPNARQPASGVHVDQSGKAAVARVYRHLPAEEVPQLLKKRFQIINLWRPISHPADDWPLALCDYRSVDFEKDIIPVGLIYPDREGEILGMKYNPNHKWKYVSGLTPEEFVLIKCSDSVNDGSVALFTPHTAFEDPNTPAGSLPRESIEIRALVFYD
ncbi:hypothetical protein CPB84DRAFT_1824872 [Gymnopilus junonius]|uniref:Methyltransferase n=1 Tax=Gymnopilus junonius TaxID=109634 RepID=A0A9P5TNF9_GYMJU|nr:hypothetical protein CPB84DRAFT_1824872 [Gymnopilus junonius]